MASTVARLVVQLARGGSVSDEARVYLRCQSCARGAWGPLLEEMDESIAAVIIPCGEMFERGDKKYECPGPRVWRRHE